MEDLIEFLKSEFPVINFQNNHKLVESGELDSLNLIRLIAALEQKYDISMPMDEISAENFNSITSIFSLIQKLTNG